MMSIAELEQLIPTVNYFVHRIAAPSWSIVRDMISFHDLTYIDKGKATYLINDVPYHVRAGDVIYIPKGNIREAYTYEDTLMQSYAFNFDFFVPGNEEVVLPFPTILQIGRFNELTDLCQDFNRTWVEKNPGYQLKARALFMQILHKLLTFTLFSNSNRNLDPRIGTIKEYIINHYFEPLEIEQLAEMFHLHPVYLGALFKKCTGSSIKEFITKIRINSAESLLSMGGYTVGEAAVRCGFEDIYYFSKVYKKYKGVPPSHALR
ncbi:MAG: AraC family transcriptional regulator [Clostridia bacterium]|nr:AraC family transcriptional regulator [Clostridia bacterium]